jgi:hypothetical protein
MATHDSVAFRFIAGNHHPDHDTISSFRKKNLSELKGWFKEILLIGNELGLIKWGIFYRVGSRALIFKTSSVFPFVNGVFGHPVL